MQFQKLAVFLFFSFLVYDVGAQPFFTVKGNITDNSGQPVLRVTVAIDSLAIKAVSNGKGSYVLENIPAGTHTITLSSAEYQPQSQVVKVTGNMEAVDFVLHTNVQTLGSVTVVGKTKAVAVKESGYSVNVIETKDVQDREVTLNQLASYSAGIRVRETGGLGSSANYSLDGMSGRSVRFFIDGIPMDRYGSAYSINNLPVNLVERIEIFKGVVPPQFGSDALGGIVNIITKNKTKNYLDASYSFGSFNTHRAALSTRWVSNSSNFFVDLQGYHNYSDNNYWVWGNGVEVEGTGGRAVQIKTRRFHDAYRSTSGKLALGFFDKKWADQLNFSMVAAGNFQELQNGTTMAAVYGEATRSSSTYSPSLFYSKRKIFGVNLDATVYSSVSFQKNILVDTSSRIYNWLGKVVNEHPSNSELGSGSNGKSLLTLDQTNWFQQLNLTYSFNERHKVYANYTFDRTTRQGTDPLIGSRTASFIIPQHLQKQISSLVYEFNMGRMSHSAWVKNYDFTVSTAGERYITDSLGYRPVGYTVKEASNNWGYGYALKYDIKDNYILKFSLEKAYRLPDAEEVLGDGIFVRVSPNLKPEESTNINLGLLVSNIKLSTKSRFNIEVAAFYRNVGNQILYQLRGTLGAGSYINVAKVRSYGGSLDLRYFYNNQLKIGGNITYQQPRDWNEYIGGGRNLTYKDLLPNTPYLMSNGDIAYTLKHLLQKEADLTVFWNAQYVHSFYLYWPSLGNQNKSNIPTQFVHNAGASYSLKSGMYNISIGIQNIFNEQVYDNYLLQKPGRSFYVKLRLLI